MRMKLLRWLDRSVRPVPPDVPRVYCCSSSSNSLPGCGRKLTLDFSKSIHAPVSIQMRAYRRGKREATAVSGGGRPLMGFRRGKRWRLRMSGERIDVNDLGAHEGILVEVANRFTVKVSNPRAFGRQRLNFELQRNG